MARIGIIGSDGNMGHTLQDVLAASGHTYAGGADKNDDPAKLADASDVLMDFSAPDGLEHTLEAARAARIPILVGTTGLDAAAHKQIDDAARSIAVLQTGNTSLGVTLLAHLVRRAAARLGSDWDIEIAETHHRRKLDAPSGTALLLGEAAAAGRRIDFSQAREAGREGIGARTPGAIGFASTRGGTVVGDHSVVFAGEQERLVLSHIAEDRTIFARGAIRAAEWLLDKPSGRYSMNDVLAL